MHINNSSLTASGTGKQVVVKMIEQVINRRNMQQACQHVVSNKGSAGVDGMSVEELSVFLKLNRDKIATALVNGTYLPQACLLYTSPTGLMFRSFQRVYIMLS